jgi:hypothetical protein
MIREIHTHKVNPANDTISIEVLDEPGAGGASHHYRVFGFDTTKNPSDIGGDSQSLDIFFQNGPINEAGVNGITQEVLLAIVQDRLESFQAGPYACDDNAVALESVKYAQEVLQRRTKARMARGVEGTHTV